MTSQGQEYPVYHLVLGVYVLIFFRNLFFMYVRPIQVQTKAHFKFLQFHAMTYDMGVSRCAIDVI